MKVKLLSDWFHYRSGDEIIVTDICGDALVNAKQATRMDGEGKTAGHAPKAKAAPEKNKMVSGPMEMKTP